MKTKKNINRKKDYENYSNISNNYDSNRRAYSMDIIIGNILLLQKTNLKILDVGCGTGNFLFELHKLLSQHKACQLIVEYYGIEPNKEMLEIAKNKFPILHTHLGYGEDLSKYKTSYFDVLICNQTLHHIIDGDSNKYDRLNRCLQEMARVVKRDGLIIIDDYTKEQIMSIWFSHLIPETANKMMKKAISLDLLIQSFKKTNMDDIRVIVDKTTILYNKELYYKKDGPLYKQWRDTDSSWSLVTKPQLNKVISNVGNMIKRGIMEEYIKKKDKIREKLGQTTFFIIRSSR
jgi:ubiquinone/menaquinone biosynthesis C-methylase UbiE